MDAIDLSINYKQINEEIQKLQNHKKEIVAFLESQGISYRDYAASHGGFGQFVTQAKTLKELKIAAIMDEFTYLSYEPECKLLQLTPNCWKEEIENFNPDLLFVESAWEGKNKLWYRKIANGSKEYYQLAEYCQNKKIPIVFWNKEDPVYTNTFLNAAKMADFVFTTDIDCIPIYRKHLKHDRIYHLHFAAQPLRHNPIEKYKRKDCFCFAGAYYQKYHQRAQTFDSFSKYFIQTKGLDIYDRNYGNPQADNRFPESYSPYILGRLKPEDIDIAYKGYLYGINMNSVDQSQTMFARRVFEMLASNTITIGNYAKGVRNYFGDLTICTNDDLTMCKSLEKYCCDKQTAYQYRLLGLRKVLTEHLYEDRLGYIAEKVFGYSFKPDAPLSIVLARPQTIEQWNRIKHLFYNQTYSSKILLMIADKNYNDIGKQGFYIDANEATKISITDIIEQLPINKHLKQNAYICCFDTHDYYGKNYLTDLMLTFRYYHGDVVGKSKQNPYEFESDVPFRRAVVSLALIKNKRLCDCVENWKPTVQKVFCIDFFHYKKDFDGLECPEVDDLVIKNQGLSLNGIEKDAENIQNSLTSQCTLTNKHILVVTNHYPAPEDLYRNMFVHRRILQYHNSGLLCDVIRVLPGQSKLYREFEGIDVLDGSATELNQLLESGKYTTLAIHFLTPGMWNIIRHYLPQLQIFIWFHGADIQPWWRRKCLYHNESDILKAKELQEEKNRFWQEVFRQKEIYSIRFVFVSNYLRKTTEEDYHIFFDKGESYVIPNCIDTDLFSYQKKENGLNRRIISIRPYASEIYANDLIVKTIETLSQWEKFDQLDFLIAGSGPMFETITAPLKEYKNVILKNTFFRQEDIAKLYQQYGVVLIPTRMDTQGVSRDEAMSSGLVPITTTVAAIPEFTDNSCAILAPEEDYEAMAEGIRHLANDFESYSLMSQNAANRVRRQSSFQETISIEIKLLSAEIGNKENIEK